MISALFWPNLTLWANVRLITFFFYFAQKTGFDILCKLHVSLLETICMNCLLKISPGCIMGRCVYEVSC